MLKLHPATVSFSGIDGAGKSTQIYALETWLRDAGLRVTVLRFWDDIVRFTRFREFMSHKLFKGDRGVGTPENPLNRRDKNVTSWPAILMRCLFYLADSISLCIAVHNLRRREADIVIFDRYIYDELANLPLRSWAARLFVNLALSVIPQPTAAFLIDADPEAARARKPEYPLGFLKDNRESYLTLSRMIGNMIVIEPQSVEAAEAKMRKAVLAKLSLMRPALSASLLAR